MRILLTGILILLLTSVYSQESFTLEEAIQYALDNSNSMKDLALDIEDANQQVREFKSIGLPQLTANASYIRYFAVPANPIPDFLSPAVYNVLFQEQVIPERDLGPPNTLEFSFLQKNSVSGGIDFNMLLFDGSYFVGLRAAKLFKDLTAKQAGINEYQITQAVTKAYIAALIAERNREILKLNIENLEKSLKDTKIIFENGFAESLDVSRLELSLNNLQSEDEKVSRLIELSKNVLKFQMSHPLTSPIELTEDLQVMVEAMTLDEEVDLEAINYTLRPEYDVLQTGIALERMNVNRLKKQALPALRAFGNVQEALSRNELFNKDEAGWIPSAYLGAGLTVPLFDGNKRKASMERAKIQIEKRELEVTEFERAVQLQVANASVQFENARNSLTSAELSMTLSEDILEKSQIKFKEGVGSSVEVRQAELSLYSAQSDYINALYDLVLAKAELDIATGKI